MIRDIHIAQLICNDAGSIDFISVELHAKIKINQSLVNDDNK